MIGGRRALPISNSDLEFAFAEENYRESQSGWPNGSGHQSLRQ